MTKFTKLILTALITFMTISVTSCSNLNVLNTGVTTENLKVHFIDVGQGDSILVQNGSKTMLIDSGPKKSEDQLIRYLDSLGLKKIDYLILTHQDHDHIGNAAKVMKYYKIGMLYMPKVSSIDVSSEDEKFTNMIKAVNKNGLSITTPVTGSSFDFGEAKCTFMAPNSDKYEIDDDYSLVFKMVYKNTSFLFTGDAGFLSEKEMLKKGYDLSADVLKVAHHGSDTSTSDEFLKKVNPKYTIVSCELNDSADHPSKKTMQRLKAKGLKVYRTDESGTIVCTSDGQNISFDKDPGNYKHGKKQ